MSVHSVLPGCGGVVTVDTRDDVILPRRGAYTQISATSYPAFFGSTSTYHRAILDARSYLPVGTGPVVALRAMVDVAGGDVPVLGLPALGGSSRLRGYLDGRLRDRAAASFQAELRAPVRGPLGAALFVEASQVAAAPRSLRWSDPEASVGVGARWRLGQEGARIRLDFARGRRGSGLYITIGEAF
jgi:outer membrane protein assembly factor BamA